MNAIFRRKAATIKIIQEAISKIGNQEVSIAITGSGGMGLSDAAEIPLSKKLSQQLPPWKDSFHKQMWLLNWAVKMPK